MMACHPMVVFAQASISLFIIVFALRAAGARPFKALTRRAGWLRWDRGGGPTHTATIFKRIRVRAQPIVVSVSWPYFVDFWRIWIEYRGRTVIVWYKPTGHWGRQTYGLAPAFDSSGWTGRVLPPAPRAWLL